MYRKTLTSKLIRVDHEVVIYLGVQAYGMKVDLSNVPDEARLIECREGNSLANEEVVLVFREEKEEADEVRT